MGLDDFTGDGSPPSSSGSHSSSAGGRGSSLSSAQANWKPKLDFGKPYVVVAEDRAGEVYWSRGDAVVLETADDWKRLEDNPHKEMKVLFKKSSYDAWLRFCNLVESQLDEDPEEVLKEDPARLVELNEKVRYPPASKPDKSRSCRICETSSDEVGVTMLEIDLQYNRKVPVCATHTIAEMANEGLLQ